MILFDKKKRGMEVTVDGLHLRSAVTLENIQVDHDVLEFYLSQALNKAI